MARKLILDCDTGTDDAVAIMLAALHPALELLGVTTVNGNVEVARCTDNSLRTLDWIGRGEIPVYEGLAKPIVRSDFPVPRAVNRNPGVHMETLPLPEARHAKQALSAPEFLVRAFRESPGEIVLVAVGPLSNLAAAIALDPAFARNAAELIIMGGAVDKSNVTPSAEFNIWADPEASAVVLAADFPKITLVPLDATHQALVSLGAMRGIARARDQCRQGHRRPRRVQDQGLRGQSADRHAANRAGPRRPLHRRAGRSLGHHDEIRQRRGRDARRIHDRPHRRRPRKADQASAQLPCRIRCRSREVLRFPEHFCLRHFAKPA